MANKIKTIAAVALLDIPSVLAKAGQIVEASVSVIAALKAAGEVDDHKAALDYARKQRVAVVRVETAQQTDDDLAAARALVDSLQDQVSAASAADRPAIELQLASAIAALEALQ